MTDQVQQRRRFNSWVFSLAFAATLDSQAQPSGRPVRIGYLGSNPPDTPDRRARIDSFRSEMDLLGWTQGSRVGYEFRFAAGADERFLPLARELVAAKVDLIVAITTPAAFAAKEATATIPVVFIAADPVEYGLVDSLARPGGNLTGLAVLADALMSKRMQLLTEAVPGISRVAYLGMNEGRSVQLAQRSAKTLNLELLSVQVERAENLARAIGTVPRADGWLVDDYVMFSAHRRQIVELIAAQRKPAVYSLIPFVHSGGLMAYGTNLERMMRQVASYVDRILRGTKPYDLPVEQPTRLVLAVNLRTARDLGVTIARSVLLQADEVVE